MTTNQIMSNKSRDGRDQLASIHAMKKTGEHQHNPKNSNTSSIKLRFFSPAHAYLFCAHLRTFCMIKLDILYMSWLILAYTAPIPHSRLAHARYGTVGQRTYYPTFYSKSSERPTASIHPNSSVSQEQQSPTSQYENRSASSTSPTHPQVIHVPPGLPFSQQHF